MGSPSSLTRAILAGYSRTQVGRSMCGKSELAEGKSGRASRVESDRMAPSGSHSSSSLHTQMQSLGAAAKRVQSLLVGQVFIEQQ